MKTKNNDPKSTAPAEASSSVDLEKMRKYLATLLIAGNDKGGIGKSTTTANVADGLKTLGYKVRLVDGDGTNETLQDLVPGIEQLRYKNEIAMTGFLGGLLQHDDDITILDLPGDSGEVLAAYFTPSRMELLAQNSIRIVIGLTLIQDMDATRGALIWAETFHSQVDFIGLANGSVTPAGEEFSLGNILGGDDIHEIVEGRLIVVPKFSDLMLDHFRRYKAVPSAYFAGGAAARALGFSFLDEGPWRGHHKSVVASVAAHAPWLTGKPIPKPETVAVDSARGDAQRGAVLTNLRKAVKK